MSFALPLLVAALAVDGVDLSQLRASVGAMPAPTPTHCDALARANLHGNGLRPIPSSCGWSTPLMWEFPGSGSTWVRRVLEAATGLATGSAPDGSRPALTYDDKLCASGALATAASSTAIFFELVASPGGGRVPWHGARFTFPGGSERGRQRVRAFRRDCAGWNVERALIVDRHPFEAITAALGRIELAHFEAAALRLAADYVTAWASYTAFARAATAGSRRTLIVDVDELRNDCAASLPRLLKWLAPPSQANASQSGARVARACALAGRRSPDADAPRSKASAQRIAPAALRAFAARAWTTRVSCRVWSVVGHIASELGHAPPHGVTCPHRDALALELAARAAVASPDGHTVVLATADSRYLDVFLNWATRTGASHKAMIVGALDWRAHDLLLELGAPVFPLVPRFASGAQRLDEGARALDGLWIERGALALLLLRAGYSVLLCDSDAVWTANVLESLPALYALSPAPGAVDAVASAGTFPPAVAERLGGHTAVMGFVLLRSTSAMRGFFNVVQRRALHVGDDQIAFNRELASGVVKVSRSAAPRAHRSATLVETAWPQSVTARPSVRVLVLDELTIVRNCTGLGSAELAAAGSATLVAHCLSDKKGRAKAEQLRAVGLWSIPSTWRSILFPSDTSTRQLYAAAPVTSEAAAAKSARFGAHLAALRARFQNGEV